MGIDCRYGEVRGRTADSEEPPLPVISAGNYLPHTPAVAGRRRIADFPETDRQAGRQKPCIPGFQVIDKERTMGVGEKKKRKKRTETVGRKSLMDILASDVGRPLLHCVFGSWAGWFQFGWLFWSRGWWVGG